MFHPESSREPPLSFTIRVNEKSFVIEEGESHQLKGIWESPTVECSLNSFRQFQFANIRFRYPQQFRFGFRETEYGSVWELRGEFSTLYLWDEYGDSHERLVHARKNSEIDRNSNMIAERVESVPFGELTLSGTKITSKKIITFQETESYISCTRIEIYDIPCANGTRTIEFQDLGDEDGYSQDYLELIQMIQQTLQVVDE